MYTEKETEELISQALEKAYQKFHEKKFEIVSVLTEQILKISPKNCNAFQLLGLSYSQLGRHEDALIILKKCLEYYPENSETINDLALAYSNKGDYDEAIKLLNKAIEINPDTSCFHSNLGLQYRHKLNHEEALSCFQKALEIKREAPTLAMIGGCYGELKNLDEAEKYILQAIEMKPDFAAAHVDLASVLKLKGKWHEGFIEYEWRYDVYDQLKVWKKIYNPEKKWHGQEVKGKRILVHTEQGHGDAIHFVRYLQKLREMEAYVILHCSEILKPIFTELADEIFTKDPNLISSWEDPKSDVPLHDYHCSVMSLPNLLHSIITYRSYINHPNSFDLSEYKEFNKIGIVWAGNPQHPNDKQRSCKLSNFKEIAKIENVKLFSLMKDTRPRAYSHDGKIIDLTEGCEEMGVVDLSSHINDFGDTASIINSLDLIIGVDTAVMHLAASMGKTCVLLLPWNPDWRWEIDGEFSIWYGSMSIVRQKEKGEWDSVFSEAKDIVEKYFN
jgi:tetratricopeptide (TPR) repeat protein